MRYPFITYAANLGGTTVGTSKFCFIMIRTDYKDDEAVYRHELQHVKQWAATSVLSTALIAAACYLTGNMQNIALALLGVSVNDLLYTFVPRYRQWAEIGAYRVEIAYGRDPANAATSLARDYGLNLTLDDAVKHLKSS